MMYIAWGILHNGTVPYQKVPWASELGKTFGTPEGISFAFMELSKYSNDSESGSSRRDVELMSAFLKDSRLEKRNFFQEELAILDPDVVITMNLWGAGLDNALLELALGEIVEDAASSKYQPYASLSSIGINEKQTPLIDLYHFSYRKNTEEYFYNPVMKIVRDLARLKG
jgi:hypothetical protein